MLEHGRESDSELSSKALNSGYSTMSSNSTCSSFSRLSIELIVQTSHPSPNNLSVKTHRSSDFAYLAICSATGHCRNGCLTFHDFRPIRRIGAEEIGIVYLCALRVRDYTGNEEPCFYSMKVVDKEAFVLTDAISGVCSC